MWNCFGCWRRRSNKIQNVEEDGSGAGPREAIPQNRPAEEKDAAPCVSAEAPESSVSTHSDKEKPKKRISKRWRCLPCLGRWKRRSNQVEEDSSGPSPGEAIPPHQPAEEQDAAPGVLDELPPENNSSCGDIETLSKRHNSPTEEPVLDELPPENNSSCGDIETLSKQPPSPVEVPILDEIPPERTSSCGDMENISQMPAEQSPTPPPIPSPAWGSLALTGNFDSDTPSGSSWSWSEESDEDWNDPECSGIWWKNRQENLPKGHNSPTEEPEAGEGPSWSRAPLPPIRRTTAEESDEATGNDENESVPAEQPASGPRGSPALSEAPSSPWSLSEGSCSSTTPHLGCVDEPSQPSE